ncbi:hypothetical protein [Candidatus Avelusimicrobium sp.]|uniref:hypothetical protein n=1 Tax=Candidatus Avelusimicrobium sp. TaxID=3048833 RepID=UPI003D7EF6E6
MQKFLQKKWVQILIGLVSWIILVWICWRWGLLLLKLPGRLYFWLWRSMLGGQMSLWVFLPAAIGVWLVWFICFFLPVPILRALPVRAAEVAGCVLAVLVGLVGVAALVYPWTVSPYVWQTVVARILWTWCVCCGTTWAILMLVLGGTQR